MIDLFTAELNNLTNDERYSAIVEFARAQPSESNRHDFKLKWTDAALTDVAAFANTFGGILIIGVEKGQKDIHAKVEGVLSNSELTTGIASAIATNISPTPPYDVMECFEPSQANKRFCVVRVKSDSRLYLVTKKDTVPAYVRNADQTRRADAAQLRGLIDKERRSTENKQGQWLGRATGLFEEMVIGRRVLDSQDQWPAGNWVQSDTYLRAALVPSENKLITLDAHDEHKFVDLIHRNYRRVRSTLGNASRDDHARSADQYEYRWYQKNLDYEGRWRVTTNLEVAHATQITQDSAWSLTDVVFYVILLLKIGSEWWESLKYFGDGVLFAELGVPNHLTIERGQSGQFLGLFKPTPGDYVISPDTVMIRPQQRQEASASIGVTFSAMRDGLPRLVASLMNALLRSLGHSVFLAEFEENVRIIMKGAA